MNVEHRSDAARAATPHDPIEFILSEHLNHRRMCKALERLADAQEFDGARVAALLDYVRFDLTLHVIDEEEDFFPLLRQRCQPEDEIDDVLSRLAAEHAEDKSLSADVRDMLNACLILRKPPSAIEGGSHALKTFAEHERRHLTLENAVIIPMARRRLDAEDLKALSRRFLLRRSRLAAEDK